MLLPALLISDLHLTANPRHEYRWGLFKWLVDECVSERVRTLLVLGDLTDAKDYHPAELTNRVVDSLTMLTKLGIEIVILQGNHDYLRAGHAYFQFLNHLPGLKFITRMTDSMLDDGPSAIFMPHSKNPSKEWAGLDFSHFNYMFMHQTVSGSVASNGQLMDGDELPPLNAGKVYSGDIHVPQVLGDVEYVGSPYHVHFGDRFKPRAVLIDKRNKAHDLHFETISRVTLKIKSLRELKAVDWLKPRDQVRLKIELPAAERHDWRRIRRDAQELLQRAEVDVDGIELTAPKITAPMTPLQRTASVALTDDEVIERFVLTEDLGGDALDAGLRVLR